MTRMLTTRPGDSHPRRVRVSPARAESPRRASRRDPGSEAARAISRRHPSPCWGPPRAVARSARSAGRANTPGPSRRTVTRTAVPRKRRRGTAYVRHRDPPLLDPFRRRSTAGPGRPACTEGRQRPAGPCDAASRGVPTPPLASGAISRPAGARGGPPPPEPSRPGATATGLARASAPARPAAPPPAPTGKPAGGCHGTAANTGAVLGHFASVLRK